LQWDSHVDVPDSNILSCCNSSLLVEDGNEDNFIGEVGPIVGVTGLCRFVLDNWLHKYIDETIAPLSYTVTLPSLHPPHTSSSFCIFKGFPLFRLMPTPSGLKML
jgi:hypothetical protein